MAETILKYLDGPTIAAAVDHLWSRLEASQKVLFDELATYIHLAEILENGDKPSQLLDGRLLAYLQQRIPTESLLPENIDRLAEVLFDNEAVAILVVESLVYVRLSELWEFLRADTLDEQPDRFTPYPASTLIREAMSYLYLMRSSFRQHGTQKYHVITPDTLGFFSKFIGLKSVDDVAHGVVSAFLSLVRTERSIAIPKAARLPLEWLQMDYDSGRHVLKTSMINETLWDHLRSLDDKYFFSNASRTYRIWFQWISQVADDGIVVECLHDEIYWQRLKVGLMNGFAEQRKYCLGIIHQSLLAASADISTPSVYFSVNDRMEYIKHYERYATLYETLVLDRYPNQILASLPELERVVGPESKVTSSMSTVLLNAALHPTIQEGSRKIVGNWFMAYALKGHSSIGKYVGFLLQGFLPWATQGRLFTSTLVLTRDSIFCRHGSALVGTVSTFVLSSTGQPACQLLSGQENSRSSSNSNGSERLVIGLAKYVLDSAGRIFQPSVIYLLKGIIQGLERSASINGKSITYSQSTIDLVLRISRLPEFQEAAGDLAVTYCQRIIQLVTDNESMELTNRPTVNQSVSVLNDIGMKNTSEASLDSNMDTYTALQAFLTQLQETKHQIIQGSGFGSSCNHIIQTLDLSKCPLDSTENLLLILEAFWDEAERREFARVVSIYLAPLLFHQACIQTCVANQQSAMKSHGSFLAFLIKSLQSLRELSEGRSYLLAPLWKCIRKAVILQPSIVEILPIKDHILRFINTPPASKVEFLFEVFAANELQAYESNRTYESYYGQREWHAYAAVIDLLSRFPIAQLSMAAHVLERLVEPWTTQKSPVPMISPWKSTLQLQAILLLTDYCIDEANVDEYLDSLMYALNLEPWPRYRFLLEWILARIYYHFPSRTGRILKSLKDLNDSTATKIASRIKIAALVAPIESEAFATKLMTHLIPFSASQKVHIRHEAHFLVPVIFDLATERGWTEITANSAFVALDQYVRSLDKFNSAAWSLRTIRLDIVKDFTLVKIFQGEYLSIDSPEPIRVTYDDFVTLQEEDKTAKLQVHNGRVPFGEHSSSNARTINTIPLEEDASNQSTAEALQPSFLQTKSGFDPSALHPPHTPSFSPSAPSTRPAPLILIASLIDNPTNLGGLSRISESFGLEALYVNDKKKITLKDFKATSVTSEKHLPIHELRIGDVGRFVREKRREGWVVVGVEQTDRSAILGSEKNGEEMEDEMQASKYDVNAGELVGTLPKKCVLVLGSEKGGITPDILAVLDRCVEIRTVGVTRSLNVQTAAGIAVYEWWRKWGDSIR